MQSISTVSFLIRRIQQNTSLLKVRLFNTTTLAAIMPKFSAHLAFMFTEKPFEDRYKSAKDCGFRCVETGFPLGIDKEVVVAAKNAANIQQVLINIFTGDFAKGEFGFAAVPGKEEDFKKSLSLTIEYAKALNVKKIHIMAGQVSEVTKANDDAYESNLRYAAGILEKENILGLIEPINKHTFPKYYLNSYERAITVLKNVNSSNLKLMLDIYHLQQIKGDVSYTIKDLMPYIGHVQIAQVPNRDEPDSSGELNYQYIFETLDKNGYNDWIGLEYKPRSTTEDGLKWLQKFGYSL